MNASPALPSWKSGRGLMGNRDVHASWTAVRSGNKMESSPHPEGLAQRLRSLSILDALMVPRDRRGIVLACGFVASAAIGLGTVLAADDPIGWAYIALAVVGYLFLQTRLVPVFLWLLVAAAGGLLANSGNASGWIELGLGAVLAGVAMIPIPSGDQAAPPTTMSATALVDSQSSAAAEDSPTRTSTDAEVSVFAPAHDQPVAQSVQLMIRSLGPLSVTADDVELAIEPRIQFLIGYLLARKVLGDSVIERAALAEEVAPGVSSGSQRDRLRKQLHELHSLHPALAGVVIADRGKVVFDISDVDFDAGRLLAAAERQRADQDLIDAGKAGHLRTLLSGTNTEFLAGFEQLDQQTTGARGVAADVLRSARLVIANARADLAKALAEHLVALGRGERCVGLLTGVLEASPRQDLARLLVAAYVQSGQTRLATQARRDYDLTEES